MILGCRVREDEKLGPASITMHSVGAADEGRGEIADCDLDKGRVM